MTRTITFQPGEKMGRFIEGLVKSGDFHNQSEVIRAGIRLLAEQQAASKLHQLRRLIDDGDNGVDVDDFSMDYIKKMLDRK